MAKNEGVTKPFKGSYLVPTLSDENYFPPLLELRKSPTRDLEGANQPKAAITIAHPFHFPASSRGETRIEPLEARGSTTHHFLCPTSLISSCQNKTKYGSCVSGARQTAENKGKEIPWSKEVNATIARGFSLMNSAPHL